jgi:prepilin-type N-terminal cleavage/methylation domain-containing protein
MKYNKGFTLVEVALVVVVIAVLASITIIAYPGITNNARNAKVESQVNEYRKALSVYRQKKGKLSGSYTWSCLGNASEYEKQDSICGSEDKSAEVLLNDTETIKQDISSIMGGSIPQPDSYCVQFRDKCWRNLLLFRAGEITSLDEKGAYQEAFIVYFLLGDVKCKASGNVGGTANYYDNYPNLGELKTKQNESGAFERSDGNTMCVVQTQSL